MNAIEHSTSCLTVKGHTVYLPEGESTTIYLASQDTNRSIKIAA
jgi:hypothetical protein